MPFQQYRKVAIAGTTIQNADMEFTVETTTKGKTKFDITIWNLTKSTFESVTKDKPAEIEAGWQHGPTATLVLGKIKSTSTEIDGRDKKYIIKGQDKGYDRMNQGFNDRWGFNTSFKVVVQDIADKLGLQSDVTAVSTKIGEELPDSATAEYSTFTTDKDIPIKRELDDLVERAQEQTDKQWEWSVRNRTLHFKPKNEGKQTAIVLSYDNSLIDIAKTEDSAEGNKENSKRLEFEMMLEPRLQKGSIVAVETGGYSGPWKVESIKHTSSTDSGDHVTSGKLLPQSSKYTIPSQTKGDS